MMTPSILTTVKRRFLKLLCPFFIDLDRGGVVLRVLRTEPQVMGMLDQSCQVVRVGGVHHVEEELAVRQVGFGALLWKEFPEFLLLHNIGDEADDAQLIILWHLNRSELGPGDKMLPACKYFFEKVLGDLLSGRHVELAYIGLIR